MMQSFCMNVSQCPRRRIQVCPRHEKATVFSMNVSLCARSAIHASVQVCSRRTTAVDCFALRVSMSFCGRKTVEFLMSFAWKQICASFGSIWQCLPRVAGDTVRMSMNLHANCATSCMHVTEAVVHSVADARSTNAAVHTYN